MLLMLSERRLLTIDNENGVKGPVLAVEGLKEGRKEKAINRKRESNKKDSLEKNM